MKVRDVMTKNVITVEPGASLKDAARLLVEHGISGLPVVADGVVLGVLSEADLLFKERGPIERRGLLGRMLDGYGMDGELKLEARDVGDAMTIPPLTIGPHRALRAAAALMLEERVNRLPVVLNGKLVGIVTRADLVRAFARSDSEIKSEIEKDVLGTALWIDSSDVSVAVDDGAVTLVGQVDRRMDAELAQDLAARVAGVVSVDSRLTWRTNGGSPT
ncbi:MAG TPA: CBS domain-containing protein [Gaiellaceae bacterium]|nr:CBS domain-containing protein [Gaiellaceae bacterium]